MKSQKHHILKRFIEFGQQKFGSDFGWQKRFADALNISQQQMTNILAARSPIGPTIRERLRIIGCDIDWLMTGEKQQQGLIDLYVPIPIIGKAIANSHGKEYFEDYPEGITWPFIKGNYFAVIVEGDSLIDAPFGPRSKPIRPWDLVVFEANKQPANGDIVLVQLKQSNERMVKIVKHWGRDDVELISANNYRNYLARKVKKTEIAFFGVFAAKFDLSDDVKKRLGIG